MMNTPKLNPSSRSLAESPQNNCLIAAQILSLTPGRMRIGVALSPGQANQLTLMGVSLKDQVGIERVRENGYSRTVTIFYNPQSVNSAQIVDKLEKLGLNFSDRLTKSSPVIAEYSRAAVEVTQVTKNLNQGVRKASNSIVDLGFLIPFCFGLLAWRQLMLKGWQLETIPWYVLAWYAFDSFIKLQRIDEGSRDSWQQG